MMKKILVHSFSLYGDFFWPPTEKSTTTTRRAVVEIWYLLDGNEKYQALLNWSVGKIPEKPEFEDTSDLSNVFDLSVDEINSHFSDHEKGTLWICKGNATDIKEKLRFRGASLFQQQHKPELEWPLVRWFYETDTVRYSELIVGENRGFLKEATADFKFSLALPSPVRQISSSDDLSSRVFVVNSWFCSTSVKPVELGWVREKDGLSLGTSKELKLNLAKNSRVLGAFGFAIDPVNKDEFAYGITVREEKFWPTGNHDSVFDFLELAGLKIKPPTRDKLEAGSKKKYRDESQASVSPNGKSGFIWKLNLLIQGNPKSAGRESSALWIKDNRLRTRITGHFFQSELKELLYEIHSKWQIPKLANWLKSSEGLKIVNLVDIRLKMHQRPLMDVLGSLKNVLGEMPQSFLPDLAPNIVGRRIKQTYSLGMNQATRVAGRTSLLPAWSGKFKQVPHPNILGSALSSLNFDLSEDHPYKYLWESKLTFPPMEGEAQSVTGRLGALSFIFSVDTNKENTHQIDLEVQKSAAGFSYILRLKLHVTDVRPITVDRPWGERDQGHAPLLIRNSNEPANQTFVLNITEQFGHNADWQLKAELLDETDDSSPAVTYNVIADQPFALFRFARLPLGSSGDAKTVAVAIYNSDSRTWFFKKVNDTDSYHYVLPPQSIGESADKPRRLEIHDAQEDKTSGGTALQPYLPSPSKNLSRSLLVEHRLTPSAELWIKPSDLERNYFLPEWSAHDIFRQRNDFGLGVALLGLRSEFLYGLTVGVDTSLEQGPSRKARVAEIEALMGRLPSVVYSNDKSDGLHNDLVERWKLLRHAMQRRHERLEIWATDPEGKQLFAPARFSEGVSFALRKSALHRAPVFNPANVDEEPEIEEPEILGSGIRYHPQGLPGGALWPIEFWNVFQELLKNPNSSGGTLDNVALSPTGGDANQKALFLDGIVSIISETRGGFVQRQQVETLGRIGAHWHRAKHVVVYERTVNPSAQFAPKPLSEKDTSHLTRSRRAILRKVSEYIELLQQERSYPDGVGVAKDRGFLRSIRYNSVRIAVDSAWGSEIGKVGYQIPLWNLYSARIRPQVYPMPDVVFNLLCEGGADDTTYAKQCLDPNNIYFFTDVESHNPNTDEWIARLGIDAVHALPASYLIRKLDNEEKPNKADVYKSSVSRILPGYRRFTWRLAPGGPKVRINAEYGERAIFADVESISFMRSVASVDESNANGGQVKLIDITQKLESEPSKLWPQWSNDIGGDSPVSNLKQLVETFNTEAKLVLDGKKEPKTDAEAAFHALRDGVNKITAADGAWAEHKAKVLDYAKQIENVGSSLGSFESALKSCESLKQDTVDAIRRKRHLVESALSEWQNRVLVDLKDILPGSKAPAKWREDTREIVKGQIGNALLPAFESAYIPIDAVNDDIEKARAIVAAAESDLERALLRVITRLDAVKAAYRDGKPWSADRIDRVHEKVRQEWMSVRGELQAMVTEARQRVSIELSQRSHELSIVVNRALQVAVDRLNDRIAPKGDAQDAFRQFFASLNAPFDKLLDNGNGVFKRANNLLSKLDGKPEIQAEVRNLLQQAKIETENAKSSVKEFESAADYKLTEVLAKAEELKKAVRDGKQVIDDNMSSIKIKLNGISGSDPEAAVKREILALVGTVEASTNQFSAWAEGQLKSLGNWADPMIDEVSERLREGIAEVMTFKLYVFGVINAKVKDLESNIEKISAALAPGILVKLIENEVIHPWMDCLLQEIPDSWIEEGNTKDIENTLRAGLADFAHEIAGQQGALIVLDRSAIASLDAVSNECSKLSNSYQDALNQLKDLSEDVEKKVREEIGPLYDKIASKINDETEYADIVKEAANAAASLGKVVDLLANAVDSANAVSQRLLDTAVQVVEGDLAAAPNNLLKLYSAATSALDTEPLQSNIHQLRCAWDDVISITKGNAILARLGDKLKALGIDIPFDQIAATFKIDNEAIKNFDFSRMFKNFAGINMDGLFSGVKIPGNIKEAINLSHDFDKKQARAWVQVDVNASVPGRNPLFSSGPFVLYFKDSHLIGNIRLEASKDTDEVEETGSSTLITSIEASVAGQVMVVLQNAALNYTQERGLNFDFDPANIKLHPNFRFIQETLAGIFPDELGGLSVIKDNGIPIGVEHVFALPNISLNFGTSGVQNIQISNRFRLLAYPDFLVANRFNLSTAEMPFIFSIFILGGTGYIQIDTEYQPASKRLLVVIEAAAGASAALAFSFGPVQGSVFMALSVALTYRKLIGTNGGGLSVSLVLVVAGNVSLWGMVRIYLGLILRMTYRDNGQIDAVGTLVVQVRVSRFFKLKYRTTVTYKLRGGRSESTRNTSVDVETTKRIDDIRKKANRLKGARS